MFQLSNGINIPKIGFGTYQLNRPGDDKIITEALYTGYRYLDTAAFYGNEELVGQALKESGLPREAVQIATKVWRTELGYEKTAASIDASLRRLNTDYVDLMLIHWPTEFPGDPDWKEKLQGSYRALEDAYQAGKLNGIGLSNFMPYHIMAIDEIATVEPVLNQLELHVGHMQYAAVNYCQERGILVQAWRPRGQAHLASHPALISMAEKYDISVTALLLKFLLQQGIAVIPRSTKPINIMNNLYLPEVAISPEDLEFLKSMPPMGWSGQHPDFDRVEPAQ